MSLSCQLKLVLVVVAMMAVIIMRFFFINECLCLIVNSILNFVFSEIGVSMAHRFKHCLMNYLTLPELLLLLLNLLRTTIFIPHVRSRLEYFGVHL